MDSYAQTISATATCNLCGSTGALPVFTKSNYQLVRCRQCDLAYIANPPSSAEIAALYSTSAGYHNQLLDPASADYARHSRIAQQHLAMLRRSVKSAQGLRLLDVGCSAGHFLSAARKFGFDVAGAELSPESAAFAQSHFGLSVHQGDWRTANYPDASFDVITLFDVIEHLADPKQELIDLRRLLKPGGFLLQSTPDVDGLFPRLSYLVANKLDYWPHPEPPHHLFQFSTKTLSAMTDKAGYVPTRADRLVMDLSYSFGNFASWKINPKLFPYALAFSPVAVIGGWLGLGDWLYLAARRK